MKFKSIATWLICSLLVLATQANAATSYQITNGTNQDIDEHGTCKNVGNYHATGNALFVPTNTSTEWSTFVANPPSGVTVMDCGGCTIAPGSQNFTTAGSFSFTVPTPCYNTLTVKVWGGGGGGGGAGGSACTNGSAGGQSKFNNALIANGGAGGLKSCFASGANLAGGAGGTASGGSTNTTGGAGTSRSTATGPGTKGGNAPGGGGAGGNGSSTFGGGAASNGTAQGGGGGGAASLYGATGGGSGGYSTKVYVTGDLTPGASLPVVVGAGGANGVGYTSAYNGGDGAIGRVTITWD